MAPLKFDVVVPTRDRPERLATCLRSLAAQTCEDFRVIVVDDGSRRPVADSMPPDLGKAQPSVVLRSEVAAGPAASRNAGVAAGDAPYLLFIDDDVQAHPDLLVRHRQVLGGEQRSVVSIGALLAPPDRRLPPWDMWQADRLARHHRRLAVGEEAPSWRDLYTGNVALCRADFEDVGGFDTAFARQEDMELGYRLSLAGCRFVFEPGAIAWHDAEHSFADWLRIPAASAQGDVLFDRIRPESGRLRAVQHDLANRHWLLRLARRAGGRSGRRGPSARVASAAGRALYRLGARRMALPAFSLVWDLEYRRALAQATGTRPPSAP